MYFTIQLCKRGPYPYNFLLKNIFYIWCPTLLMHDYTNNVMSFIKNRWYNIIFIIPIMLTVQFFILVYAHIICFVLIYFSFKKILFWFLKKKFILIPKVYCLNKEHWFFVTLWLYAYYKPYILAFYYIKLFKTIKVNLKNFFKTKKNFDFKKVPALFLSYAMYVVVVIFSGINKIVWKYIIVITNYVFSYQQYPYNDSKKIVFYSNLLDFLKKEIMELAQIEKNST